MIRTRKKTLRIWKSAIRNNLKYLEQYIPQKKDAMTMTLGIARRAIRQNENIIIRFSYIGNVYGI